MQTATAYVKINRETVLKKEGITPAEVLILDKMFRNKAGEFVVQSATYVGEAVQSEAGEVQRLKGFYKSKVVDSLWPGVTKKLPRTFAEVGVTLTGLPKPVAVAAPEADPAPEEVPVTEAPVDKSGKVKKAKLP